MTNTQLWLSIGIPSFLILLSWIQTNNRLSDLRLYFEARFSEVNRRFDEVERRFDRVESRIRVLEADYREFYGMEKKLEGRVDELSKR